MRSPSQAWHSLRWRLPLLIGVLIVAIVGVVIAAAFRQVQGTLLQAAGARMQGVAQQLASLVAQSMQQRLIELHRVTAQPAVQNFLERRTVASREAARVYLASLPSPVPQVVELWDATGEHLLSVSTRVGDEGMPTGSMPAGEGLGPLLLHNSRLYSDTAAAIDAPDTTEPPSATAHARSAYLVIRRPLALSGGEALNRLVGGGVVVKVGSKLAGAWTDLSNPVPPPPVPLTRTGIASFQAEDGERGLGALADITGTSWAVWVEIPESAVLAPARTFLRDMIGIGFLVVLTACLAVSMMIGRITTPLSRLTEASKAMSGGEPGQRVAIDRGDEIGQLATAFNAMSEHVESARRELEDRVEQRTAGLTEAQAVLARKTSELSRSESRLRQVLYTAHDAFVAMDIDGRIIDWNPQAEATFGWARADVLGQPLVETIIPARYREAHRQGLRDFRTSGEAPVLNRMLELEALHRDGREFPIEFTISAVQLEETWQFFSFLRDITTRRTAEQKFRALLTAAPDAIVIVDQSGRIVLVNTQAELIFGYPRSELLGRPIEMLIPDRFRDGHAGHRGGFFTDAKTRQMGAGIDLAALRKDGSEFPAEISLSPMKTDGELLVMAAVRDVTERKLLQDRLQTSLSEKDLLIKEVHHRVKNNLQVIASMLRLQSHTIHEPEALAALAASHDRVRTIALMHESLYQSEDLTHVNVATYTRNLVGGLVRTHGIASSRIAVDLQVGDVHLPMDAAVHCGLLMNELVSNALKHAFPNDRRGDIRVALDHREDGGYFLSVRDNGVGLPEGFDIARSDTLGLQLVATLVKQVDGTLDVRRDRGTEFLVTFKADAGTSGVN